jgi:hypothetical protein
MSADLRGGDGRAVQRAAIAGDERGRFVAEEFGEHRAGVVHRGTERAQGEDKFFMGIRAM